VQELPPENLLPGCHLRDFDPVDNADLLSNTLMLITDFKLCQADIELYHQWRNERLQRQRDQTDGR
jgi:hypothetical protein